MAAEEQGLNEFVSVLKRVCFDFFVEMSQDDALNAEEVQTMTSKLQQLIDKDLAGKEHLMRPDCIDVLVELLKNENTFNLSALAILVVQTLERVSRT